MIFILIIASVLVAVLVAGEKIPAFGAQVPNDKTKTIAQAIAHAEGYGANPNNLPTRNFNPGDLKLGDLGYGTDGGKTKFANAQDGWNALYKQIDLMISGGSSYYSPSDSWRVIARTWVGTSDYTNWLATVTSDLGVDPDSTLQEYMDA